MDWRTVANVAGIWGAVVSTVLALAKLIPAWPVVTVVPQERPGDHPLMVGLSVFNPSKRSLIIDGNRQFPRSARPYRFHERRGRNTRADLVLAFRQNLGPPHLEPRLFVPAQGEAILDVSGIEEAPEGRLIVLWWHRNWLIRRRLPAWVRVSAELASAVDRRPADL